MLIYLGKMTILFLGIAHQNNLLNEKKNHANQFTENLINEQIILFY